MLLLVPLLLPFIFSFLLVFLPRLARTYYWVTILPPLIAFFCFFYLFLEFPENFSKSFSFPWIPSLGIVFSLLLDSYSLFFALLISGVGFLVVLYSLFYLSETEDLSKYFAYLLLFMGAMLGIVLSDDLIFLFVFWEITSVSSFLLIGFWHEKESARKAAFPALFVTVTGGLCMLAGFILLYSITHTFSFSELVSQVQILMQSGEQSGIIQGSLLLILLGIFTKSAQFPFHFWLPSAMEAPTPISSYLHAATMVKAGIFMLARLSPAIAVDQNLMLLIAIVGTFTFFWGAYLSLRSDNLKQILAYTTVSALGNFVLLYALSGKIGAGTDALVIFSHAAYKGTLFLIAGILTQATGFKNLSEMNGLGRKMPFLGLLSFLALWMMAALPFTPGFLGKEIFYERLWLYSDSAITMPLLLFAVLSNALIFATAARIASKLFFEPATGHIPHPPGWGLVLPCALLIFPAQLLGVTPALVEKILLPFSSKQENIALAFWHGFSPAFVLSLLTYACGFLFFWLHRRGVQVLSKNFVSIAGNLYEGALRGLNDFSTRLTVLTQNGSLHFYLKFILLFSFLLPLFSLLLLGNVPLPIPQLKQIDLSIFFFAALVLVAGIFIIRSRTRLSAVLALSVIGYSLAVIFALFRSPDILMTQILIETVTLLLFLLIFLKIPPYEPNKDVVKRKVSAPLWISLLVGFSAFLFVFLVTENRTHPSISQFFLEGAERLAGGRNVVNMIIVDFRTMDTFGEIVVLGLAGIGALALLRSVKNQRGEQ